MRSMLVVGASLLLAAGILSMAGALDSRISGVVTDGTRPCPARSCGSRELISRRELTSGASSHWIWPGESRGPLPR